MPKAGKAIPGKGYWSHELEFWGGDLPGVSSRLDYIKSIGADAVYLTPIFEALSNHKYDTTDYYKIAPEFGTERDLKDLIHQSHGMGLKVLLDGVFNHVGKQSPIFREASTGYAAEKRDWFTFGSEYKKNGYLSFADVPNLPTWRLENPAVRRYLWKGGDSVVRHWLKKGVDGWRLDVAYEIGPKYLYELTKAAHETKPGSSVVGEIRGYPSDWFPSVDGVFNFFPLDLGHRLLSGEYTGAQAGQILDDMLRDAPYENLLKSWLVTDNHDTDRLASVEPDRAARHLIQALQFTMPGAPVVYYGTELGMQGTGDPGCRAPMKWELAVESNKDLAWIRKLGHLRQAKPALRYGDMKVLRTQRLLAYVRYTNQLRKAVIVVINPTGEPITESIPTRIGQYMSWATLRDELSGTEVRTIGGFATFAVAPKTVQMYSLYEDANGNYKPHHRIE